MYKSIDELSKMMDFNYDAAVKAALNKRQQAPGMDELADIAASRACLIVEDWEDHFDEYGVPHRAGTRNTVDESEPVTVDATAAVMAELEYWEEGQAEIHGDHSTVQTAATLKGAYIVDADGEVVPGARIMVEYDIEDAS